MFVSVSCNNRNVGIENTLSNSGQIWVRVTREIEKIGDRNEKLFRIIDYHTKNVKHFAQEAILGEVFFETIKFAIKKPIPSVFQFARTAPN